MTDEPIKNLVNVALRGMLDPGGSKWVKVPKHHWRCPHPITSVQWLSERNDPGFTDTVTVVDVALIPYWLDREPLFYAGQCQECFTVYWHPMSLADSYWGRDEENDSD